MNETIDLMRRHRSIRMYTDDPVPDEHVRAAVAAAQCAATSSNVQAYCAIRVRDEATREKLVPLTGDQTKVARCGAFFAICGDTRRHRLIAEQAGRAYDPRLEAFLLAVIDASLFAQNLVLAFESLGYGICYIGGLRNALPETDALLEIPPGVYPLYGLCVGVPAQDPAPRPRLPVEAVLFDDRYPSDERMRTLITAYDGTMRGYYAERGAPGRSWSDGIIELFERPRRAGLAGYYRGKGAKLD